METSELHLVTKTMTGHIGRLINLEILTRGVTLNENLIGIKCDGVAIRGNIPKPKTKKKPPSEPSGNKNKGKIDFFNQCTIIVNPIPDRDPHKKTNAKLFNNGRVVLTGIKDEENGSLTIQKIIHGINNTPEGQVTYQALDIQSDDFETYLKKNYKILNYILRYALDTKKVDYFPKLATQGSIFDIIAQIKKIKDANHKIKDTNSKLKKGQSTESPQEYLVLDPEIVKEVMILKKLFQIFSLYTPVETLLTLFNDPPDDPWIQSSFFTKIVDQSIDNYDPVTRKIELILPVYLKKDCNELLEYKPSYTKLEMINSFFYSNFQINRGKLHQILINKYGISAVFEPDTYQGINAKYISRVDCPVVGEHTCVCTNKKKCHCRCKCKKISVFIFRKGTVIITGAKSWEQIEDSYAFMNMVLANEYDEIYLEPAKKDEKSSIPNEVITEEFIWLRKKHILNNPQNEFLIGEFNLNI